MKTPKPYPLIKEQCRKMRFCSNNFKGPRTTVFAVSLTVAVLGFSIFGSIYANTVSHAETAYLNMYSYALQGDSFSGQESYTYQRIAKEWLKSALFSEDKMASRAYSTKWCLGSLVFLGITFALLFKRGKWWIIPLILSYPLLLFSIVTFLDKDLPESTYRCIATKYPPMALEIDKDKGQTWFELKLVIDTHPYLSCYQQYLIERYGLSKSY
jgi:hypothetical protein